MAKASGMGARLFVDGYDISADVSNVNNLSTPLTQQNVTGIDKYAMERIGLLHDGLAEFGHYWNPTNGTGDAIHTVLKGLPRTDRIVSYFHNAGTIGEPAASLVALQVNYDWNRANDGSMTGTTSMQANGYGLAWGVNLTAGKRTEAAAGNGTSLDLGSTPISYSFGWVMFLHVFALTGTSVTVKVQDSADNATWADITGATFAAATGAGQAQRVVSPSATATVRRYVRVVSSGTYTNAVYAVNFVRFEAAAS